jgi:hypothetical protein
LTASGFFALGRIRRIEDDAIEVSGANNDYSNPTSGAPMEGAETPWVGLAKFKLPTILSRERGALRARTKWEPRHSGRRRFNGHSGCSTWSAVCLHWRLLGTARLVCNLACVRGAGNVGNSKSVDSDYRHRGIFHLSAYSNAAAFVGTPRIRQQRKSIEQPGNAGRVCAPAFHAASLPVGYYRLNWFFPALMVLLGTHYLPFASLYGMRMFLFLAATLIAMGVVIALYFSETFSLGAWLGGLVLFVFAWIGRSIATAEARTWTL